MDRDRVAACFDFAGARARRPAARVGRALHLARRSRCAASCSTCSRPASTRTLACAALLHDVVEDTDDHASRIVEKRFGKEVAGLVEGVTKLVGLHFDSREAAQAENFRKMLLSMSRDLRVIFIKLADRAAQHAHDRVPASRTRRSASPPRRATSTRRWRTGSAWRASSASSRT